MRIFVNDPPNTLSSEMFEQINRDINRNQNINYLVHVLGGGDVLIIRNGNTEERQVYLPSLHIRFGYELMEEFPLRFREFIDALLIRAMEERSRLFSQPNIVKSVSADHGRQYFITQKMLDGKPCEKNCSICLDPLLGEGKKCKKIWELECGDCFHKQCIAKWQKNSSRCPNCRHECSAE